MVRSHALYPTELRAQKFSTQSREGLFRTSMYSTPVGPSNSRLRDFDVQICSRQICRTLSSISASIPLSHQFWIGPFGPIQNWRRERDSNPRWAFDPYTLSRGAPST